MRKLLLLVMLFAAMAARAQSVEKQTFVYAVKDTDTLRLDRYAMPSTYAAPAAADATKPCLMFVFGGGFVSGSRDHKSYLSYFDYYARQGYVVVSIDYRLGLKKAIEAGTLNEQTFSSTWVQTLAMATGDLYDATAYVITHSTEWGVDPSMIVASGSSAGAITVLMGEYGICNDHPMAKSKLPQNFNYAGVISYAGAIFDMQTSMRWAHDPAPVLLFHGDADRNVPYDIVTQQGAAGFFGSKHISEQLTERKSPHWLYSAANTDHVMAVRPMTDNREEIDSFLRKLVKERRRLIITTGLVPLDAKELPKTFTMMEYIRSNFGGGR